MIIMSINVVEELIQGGITMRIDQVGVSGNISQAPSQPSTTAGRTEAPAKVQSVKQPVKQEKSAVKIQERNLVEAEIAAEKRTAEQEHEVISAIEKANKHIRTYDRRLEFSIHDSTKQIMVKVINTEDDTIIREIPSEKVLDMVAHLWEVAGILVDEQR